MFPAYAYESIQNFIISEPPSAQSIELAAICRKYPVAIPVPVAAKFLGVSKECLRTAMDQNHCPFGFGWKKGDRAGYKIPTMAFYAWLTKGTSSMQPYYNSGGGKKWRPANRDMNVK